MEDFDLLLVKQNVFLYKMHNPTEKIAEEPFGSADWNFCKPERRVNLIIASIKIKWTQKTQLQLQLQDENSGELICKSIGDIGSFLGGRGTCYVLWPVADSRRFFILKAKNSSGAYQFHGIGFADYLDSLDFTNTLKNYIYKIKCESHCQNPRLIQADSDGESNKFVTEFKRIDTNTTVYYYCDKLKCGQLFDNETTLKNHKRDREKDLNCLNDTKRSRTASQPICKYCGRMFTTNSQLQKHRSEVHKSFCRICSITFPTKNLLKRHLNDKHNCQFVL